MITITLPEWFLWAVVFFLLLEAVLGCIQIYREYLKQKLARLMGSVERTGQ